MDGPITFGKDRLRAVMRHDCHLPHWQVAEVATFVTFHLADSLPAVALAKLRRDGQLALDPAGSAADTYKRFGARFRRIDAYLDALHGCKAFSEPAAASLMADALRHFDGHRYTLWCWSVMPNHVHAVLSPNAAEPVASIVQSWKRYAGVHVNRLLGRNGPLFQREYFDHLVREGRHFDSICRYVLRNPEAAGLVGWQWVGTHPIVAESLAAE